MKLARFFGAVVLLALLSVSGYAQARVKVACIGDSITAGAGATDREKTSYPPVLGVLLGGNYEVKNFGIGGRTLLKQGDRPYWNENLFQQSQDFEPDIVVVKLGTNDTKPQNWDQYSVEFEGDLREMLSIYKNLPSQPKVYVCYPVWAAQAEWGIRETVIAAEVIPIIYKVAAELNVSIIDLHATLYGMPQLLPDGIHPNDLGYTLLAKDIYDRIK